MRTGVSSKITEQLILQLQDAVLYLPGGYKLAEEICCVIVIGSILLCLALHKKITRKFLFQILARIIIVFFLITYTYCVLQLTILSRIPLPRYNRIDWGFLSRWFESDAQKACYIANIVMFFPLGILLPMAGKPMRHILIAAPTATLCSIGIEAVQLKYHLGACQLDDVLLNSFGFLLGFLVYLALADIYGLLSAIAKFLYRHSKELLKNKSSHLQS